MIAAAITPLIATGKMRSERLFANNAKFDGKNVEITYGARGARIPNPANPHPTKLISDHSWRIILALLDTEKSAPLKPMESAIGPTAKTKNKPSRRSVRMVFNEGW